jgi:hypothetical protein
MHDRCNRALGFIEWSLQHIEARTFFDNIIEFLESHKASPSKMIHPRHKQVTRESVKRQCRLPRTKLSEQEKALYKKALEMGPMAHPQPKKNTNPLGSWRRTAETLGINHGRLLCYVAGERSLLELE